MDENEYNRGQRKSILDNLGYYVNETRKILKDVNVCAFMT